jgi:SAM-dependent methyltransferase
MKPDMLAVLRCPVCSGQFVEQIDHLACLTCGQVTPLSKRALFIRNDTEQPECDTPGIKDAIGTRQVFGAGIPLFTIPPEGMIASKKQARGPEIGTPWRQANWRFLESQLGRLPGDALILDVGAGRGDFAEGLADRRCLALDVYPYPEVDIVCDLTQVNPFRPGSFEAILLLNVLEHVYDSHTLMATLTDLLKPGGVIIIAIPFMVKIHQAPVDFVRYTHFTLERLGESHGLQVDSLEGFYDPVFFLGEGIGNIRNATLPGLQAGKRYLARALLACIQWSANLIRRLTGPGRLETPSTARSMAPTGYHLVYRKIKG